MAKKQVTVSLRRPQQAEAEAPIVVGTPSAPSVVDAFVEARPIERAPTATPSTLPGRVVVSLQLPQELANQLLVRCLDEDRDASNVVATLVREWLDGDEREREIGWRDVVRWARQSLATQLPFMRAFGR